MGDRVYKGELHDDAMDGLIEMHELIESFKTLQLNR